MIINESMTYLSQRRRRIIAVSPNNQAERVRSLGARGASVDFLQGIPSRYMGQEKLYIARGIWRGISKPISAHLHIGFRSDPCVSPPVELYTGNCAEGV